MVTPPLEPGTHEVVANVTTEGKVLPPATARIDVAKRTEAQAAYAKQMADLPPLNERMRDLEG